MTRPDLTEADLDARLDDVVRSHHEPLRRHVAEIARLVGGMTARDGDAAGDPAVLLEIRQLVEGLAACVEQQLSVEQQTLFPMLRRLQRQTFVSKCHAGMVRSRVAVAERDLARIRGVMVRLRDLGNEILPPHDDGDCDACHAMLRVIEEAIANLRELTVKESEVLFAWAVAREQMLAG